MDLVPVPVAALVEARIAEPDADAGQAVLMTVDPAQRLTPAL